MQVAPGFNWKVRPVLTEVCIGMLIALVAIGIHWKFILDGLPVNAHALSEHIVWIQNFSQQLAEGIIYPRWLASTNYGYGSPALVFYPPLVYYLGAAFKLSGLTTEQTVTALFVLASWTTGVTVYLLGRSQWGQFAGLMAALAYITNPYQIYNIYIRGTIPETWALAWMPLGFFFTYKAITSVRWQGMPALGFFLVALTHLPGLVIYTICWIFYTLSLYLTTGRKIEIRLFLSALLGLGMAAFFLLPAVVEKALIDNKELKNTMGGFQANFMGTAEEYVYTNPFVIDVQNIFIISSLVAIVLLVGALYSYRFCSRRLGETFIWASFLIFIAFLMSPISKGVWQLSSTLQMLQFPWRFLGVYWLGVVALLGLFAFGINQENSRLPKMIIALVLLSILGFNLNYIYQKKDISTLNRPGKVVLYANDQRLISRNPGAEQKRIEIRRAIEQKKLETLKMILSQRVTEQAPDPPAFRPLIRSSGRIPQPEMHQPLTSVIRGQATVKVLAWTSYYRRIQVFSQTQAVLSLRTYDFPAWKLTHEGAAYPKTQGDDGSIQIAIAPGAYDFELSYGWTSAFAVGVVLSIASTLALGWLWPKTG